MIGAIREDSITIDEKVFEYTIQLNGGMANVWVQYEFYIDNDLLHTGVNSIQLFKSKEGWKIIYVFDTRNKTKN